MKNRENKFSTFSDLGNRKKGQAAMEFLMTYGWAILAAIIVIGVIAIYFRPGSLTGQVSIFSPPFTAVSQSITDSDEIALLEIRNSGAETVNIASSSKITVTVNSPTGADCTPVLSTTQTGGAVGDAYPWGSGTTLFLRCDVNADSDADNLVKDKTFDADVRIAYTSGAGTLEKVATGTIAGKINA